MIYLKKHFLIAIVLIGLSSPLFAKPPLWEAMEAFENGEDERAATLFRPLAPGNPIVRPYLEYLNAEGLPEAEDLRFYATDTYARGWFDVSRKLRRVNELTRQIQGEANPKGKARLKERRERFIAKELTLGEQHIAAHYAAGSFFESGILLSEENDREKNALAYYSAFREETEEVDVRILLALKRLNAKITLGEVDICSKVPILEHLLQTMDVGAATFKFARLFETSAPDFYLRLVRSAAFHGVMEAQFKTAKKFSNSTEEVFYWFMQAAQQGHNLSQVQVAHMLEMGVGCKVDPQKCFKYSQLGINSLTEPNSTAYFNHGHRLMKGIGIDPNPEQAEVYFKLAVDSGGDDDMVWEYGRCLRDRGRSEEARKVWEPLALRGHLSALQDFAVSCQNPQDYLHLLPICLEKAKADDHALRLVTQLVCQSRTQTIDLGALYDLLGRFEASSNTEDREFGCLYRAALLLHLNKERRLKGDVVELLKRAMNLGSAVAAYELGDCYLSGRFVDPNLDEALKHFRTAAKGGIGDAHQKIGFILMERHDPSVDAEAIENLRKAIEMSSELQLFAKFNLAIMYSDERGGSTRDFPVIMKLLEDCLNNPELRLDALYHLAKCEFLQMIQGSEERERHSLKALEHLEEGVGSDHAPSLFLKGHLLYGQGENNSDRRREGVQLLREAAKKDYPAALMTYAFLMILGDPNIPNRSHETVMKVLRRLSKEHQTQFYKTILTLKEDLLRQVAVEEMERGSKVEAVVGPQSMEDNRRDDLTGKGKELDKGSETESVDPRLERLLTEIDQLAGKKQVKWRLFERVMKKFVTLTSGGFKAGKGSGLHVNLAGVLGGLHIPHGRNANELTGGRLESMRALLEQAVRGELSQAQIAGLLEQAGRKSLEEGPSSQPSSSSSQSKKKGKKKKH